MRVIDNFLPTHLHKKLVKDLLSPDFPWYFGAKISEDVDSSVENFQFSHLFYSYLPHLRSGHYDSISAFDKVHRKVYTRIKANLEPHRETAFKSAFHYDYVDEKGNPYTSLEVGIYYLNSCNGYTEFEDGKKVDSVANRMLLFNNGLKHRGVSQTDTRYRCVLNFNSMPLTI